MWEIGNNGWCRDMKKNNLKIKMCYIKFVYYEVFSVREDVGENVWFNWEICNGWSVMRWRVFFYNLVFIFNEYELWWLF